MSEGLQESFLVELENMLSEENIKRINAKVKSAMDEAYEAMESDLREYLAPQILDYAERRVKDILHAILSGDESYFRTLVGSDEAGYTGRFQVRSWGAPQDPADQHRIICGKLSEHNPLALRKKLVEAYPELLKSERILDLEDQVASLVAQNARQARTIELLREESAK